MKLIYVCRKFFFRITWDKIAHTARVKVITTASSPVIRDRVQCLVLISCNGVASCQSEVFSCSHFPLQGMSKELIVLRDAAKQNLYIILGARAVFSTYWKHGQETSTDGKKWIIEVSLTVYKYKNWILPPFFKNLKEIENIFASWCQTYMEISFQSELAVPILLVPLRLGGT